MAAKCGLNVPEGSDYADILPRAFLNSAVTGAVSILSYNQNGMILLLLQQFLKMVCNSNFRHERCR